MLLKDLFLEYFKLNYKAHKNMYKLLAAVLRKGSPEKRKEYVAYYLKENTWTKSRDCFKQQEKILKKIKEEIPEKWVNQLDEPLHLIRNLQEQQCLLRDDYVFILKWSNFISRRLIYLHKALMARYKTEDEKKYKELKSILGKLTKYWKEAKEHMMKNVPEFYQ